VRFQFIRTSTIYTIIPLGIVDDFRGYASVLTEENVFLTADAADLHRLFERENRMHPPMRSGD
jgi:hypothetical protein